DVGGQQIDGELDAGEGEVDGLRECRDQERLGQSWHALEQQMAAGEQGDEKTLNDDILSDNDLADALADVADELHRCRKLFRRADRGSRFCHAVSPGEWQESGYSVWREAVNKFQTASLKAASYGAFARSLRCGNWWTDRL